MLHRVPVTTVLCQTSKVSVRVAQTQTSCVFPGKL